MLKSPGFPGLLLDIMQHRHELYLSHIGWPHFDIAWYCCDPLSVLRHLAEITLRHLLIYQ